MCVSALGPDHLILCDRVSHWPGAHGEKAKLVARELQGLTSLPSQWWDHKCVPLRMALCVCVGGSKSGRYT